jgi:membrane protease YdiL (CAAX protease family)
LTLHLPRKVYLGLEFFLLFIFLPAGLRVCYPGRFLLPLLWLAAAICLNWLWRRPAFKRSELWSFSGQARNISRILARFVVLAFIIGISVAQFAPDRLFHLVQTRPVLWLIIMVLYPLLSVYPQGIVYRSFIFNRYGDLFPTPPAMIIASAVAFTMLHLVFGNLLAVGLTFIGGIIFAHTYRWTNSMMVSSVEHALYGCFIFTIGLGAYFFHGR